MTSHLENNESITLFRSHFERIQRRLEAEGKAAQSSHHGLNRGLIREAFIREFLSENISEFWGVGTGEIFHPEAQEEEIRNQIDVVIHNKRYPKLPISGGIDLFFIETVSSFIEIKSRLTRDAVKQAADAAKRIKSLASFEPQRFNPTGMIKNPRPYAFMFAYEGPAKVETVLRWMMAVSKEDDYGLEDLRNTNPEDRQFSNHLFIDGIFVLGKGFVLVDALPFESQIARAIQQGLDVDPSEIWVQGLGRELEMLWISISTLNEKYLWNNFEMASYLGLVNFKLADRS